MNNSIPPSRLTLQDLHQTNNQGQQHNNNFDHHHHQTPPDDFLDQMLCNLPSWSDLHGNPNKSPWDLNPKPENNTNNNNSLQYDESILLASRLRQHQITADSPTSKSMLLQQQQLRAAGIGGDSSFLPIPLTLGNGADTDNSAPGLYNGFSNSLPRPTQHFNHAQNGSISTQNFGAAATGMNQAVATGNSGGGGGAPPVRQRVRARRGQATDPHSIAERLRRERIAERMKGLQELVPNANKTDKASMLDEIIDYVKFLQLQVKASTFLDIFVLSMSRLGGAAAVAPLLADISTEGGADSIQTNGSGGRSSNGAQPVSVNDSLTVTENQVAKLMEEDMGSAMQYLQGKGLCLMPISLASAISTATGHSRNPKNNLTSPFLCSNLDGPTSPSISVLTVQSTMGNGIGEPSVRDATSVSKP
ncbi:hypothetical protein IFM89_030334 [Coptis chinensis]|uniref:BHLH domain-containing protein n=1 Tax=Coptis chinensis TaxID=261450 RepID=A0A835M4X8_9MAGN|nr:hypothetical protein IFM89_030334 [Coptis chinensis]